MKGGTQEGQRGTSCPGVQWGGARLGDGVTPVLTWRVMGLLCCAGHPQVAAAYRTHDLLRTQDGEAVEPLACCADR